MPDWLEALLAARGSQPVALVTILSTEGSAPRRAGSRMTVTAGESIGTIGGGALEFRATEQARAILALPPGSWRVQDGRLGPCSANAAAGRCG
jgi:xanthine dehydrogenase accessory factor